MAQRGATHLHELTGAARDEIKSTFFSARTYSVLQRVLSDKYDATVSEDTFSAYQTNQKTVATVRLEPETGHDHITVTLEFLDQAVINGQATVNTETPRGRLLETAVYTVDEHFDVHELSYEAEE